VESVNRKLLSRSRRAERKGRFSLLLTVLGAFAVAPSAAAIERDAPDHAAIGRLRERTPRAAELLEKGETLGAAGKLEEAVAVFRQGEALDAMDPLLFRRECEALTALGRRSEAVERCTTAMSNIDSNHGIRALVRAYVTGPNAPAPIDLLQALTLMSGERRRNPGGAWVLTGMACDIAEGLGDRAMLQECAGHLAEVAPGDPETRRALALLQSQCPAARLWAGWLAIVALCAVTVAHAIARARRGGAAASAMDASQR